MFLDEEKEALLATKSEGATLSAEEEATCLANAKKSAASAVETATRKNVDSENKQSPLDTAFKAWLTNKNDPRKAGDVYTNVSNYDAFNKDVTSKEDPDAPEDTAEKDYANSESTYTISLLNSGLQRIDGTLRSVGHILFNKENYVDEKTGEPLTTSKNFTGEKKILADRVLAKHGKLTTELMAAELIALMIEEGKLEEKTENGKTYYEMDEAVFEAYGKQYTDDSSVNIDNVNQGQMVKSFEKWMFDSSRVLNEVTPTAVESTYGHHIMIYRGDEKVAWSYKIRIALAEGQYDAWVEQQINALAIEYNTDNLTRIVI